MMGKEKGKTKKGNEFAAKAVLGTVAIVAGLFLFMVLLNTMLPLRGFDRFGPMVRNYFVIQFVFASSVFLLSIYLTYIYLKDYLELKSNFTLGILFAVLSFMMFSVTAHPAVLRVFGLVNGGAFSLLSFLFAAVALGILAWVSSK